MPTCNGAYQTRHVTNMPFFSFKHDFLENTFCLSAILGWKKLDLFLRNLASCNIGSLGSLTHHLKN